MIVETLWSLKFLSQTYPTPPLLFSSDFVSQRWTCRSDNVTHSLTYFLPESLRNLLWLSESTSFTTKWQQLSCLPNSPKWFPMVPNHSQMDIVFWVFALRDMPPWFFAPTVFTPRGSASMTLCTHRLFAPLGYAPTMFWPHTFYAHVTWSQMIPKWSQMTPKWSQMTPNWLQRTPLTGHKLFTNGPHWLILIDKNWTTDTRIKAVYLWSCFNFFGMWSLRAHVQVHMLSGYG